MIRAYDDNGNVVDLVTLEKQIRADVIDELKEKFFYEVDGNIFTDDEKFKYSRKDQEKICAQNIAWKRAKAIFEYLAEQLKEQKNE